MALAASPAPLTRADRLALSIAVAIESAVAHRIERRETRRAHRADIDMLTAAAREDCAVNAHRLGICR